MRAHGRKAAGCGSLAGISRPRLPFRNAGCGTESPECVFPASNPLAQVEGSEDLSPGHGSISRFVRVHVPAAWAHHDRQLCALPAAKRPVDTAENNCRANGYLIERRDRTDGDHAGHGLLLTNDAKGSDEPPIPLANSDTASTGALMVLVLPGRFGSAVGAEAGFGGVDMGGIGRSQWGDLGVSTAIFKPSTGCFGLSILANRDMSTGEFRRVAGRVRGLTGRDSGWHWAVVGRSKSVGFGDSLEVFRGAVGPFWGGRNRSARCITSSGGADLGDGIARSGDRKRGRSDIARVGKL